MNWFTLLEAFKKGGVTNAPPEGTLTQISWSEAWFEEQHVLHLGKYAIELEDADFNLYSAWYGAEELGEGTVAQCKLLCSSHAAQLDATSRKGLSIELNERDRDRLKAVAQRRNMSVEDTAVGLIQQGLRAWEKNA